MVERPRHDMAARLRTLLILSILSGILLPILGADGLQQSESYLEQNRNLVAADKVSFNVPCEPHNPTDVSVVSCEGLQDAFYQDPSTTNCSQFFRCIQGARVNCSCGQHLVFNADTQECVMGDQKKESVCPGVSHLGTCSGRADGYYPIAGTDCRRYHECRRGKYRDHVCAEGATFDAASGGCHTAGPSGTTCPDHDDDDDDDNERAASVARDECHERPDGKYAVHRGIGPRTHFYVCSGGLKMAQGSCLEGQSFVVELQRCAASVAETNPASTAAPPDEDNCGSLPDGYHPDLVHLCRSFFLCRSGQRLLEMTCPPGTHFDRAAQRCTDAPPAPECAVTADSETESDSDDHGDDDSVATVAPGECTDRPDGYHPSPFSGCRRFVSCQGGQATSELTCPSGQAFDAGRGRCLLEHKVHCPDKHQPPSMSARGGATVGTGEVDHECGGKADDYYPDYTVGCRSFFYCQNGRKTAMLSCHGGQAFDPKTKSCRPVVAGAGFCQDWSQDEDSGEEDEEEGGDEDDAKCRGLADGYYGDVGRQCRRFHYCSGERVTTQLTCARGQAFDDGARECLPQGQVDCRPTASQGQVSATAALLSSAAHGHGHSHRSSDPCPSLENDDGFHPDYAHGCRRYVHCRNGSRVAEYLCTVGQLFDPVARRCLPRALVHCSAPPPGPPRDAACRWWDDGYYPSLHDNCRTYFYCRNGLKIVDLACLAGQRFDIREKACTDEKAAGPCHLDVGMTETGRCADGQKDGAYPEAPEDHTNCSTRYYVCRKGSHQGSFQCPTDHCFDGRSGRCEESSPAQDCRTRLDGSFGDPRTQCVLYFRCRGGIRVGGGRCSPGLRYHPIRQMCLPQQRVPCAGSKTATTPSPASAASTTRWTTALPTKRAGGEGFHFRFETDCSRSTLCFDSKQDFSERCINGQQSGNAYCQVGSIGSATQHGMTTPVARSPQQSDFDCSAKEDGHYVDMTSQCRRWHVCTRGLSSTYECPKNSAFDLLHRRCDEANKVDCSAAQSWVYRNHSEAATTGRVTFQTGPCRAKPDGLYVNLKEGDGPLGSACFPVHLCVDGQMYGINCPTATEVDCSAANNDFRCKQQRPPRNHSHYDDDDHDEDDVTFPFDCSGRADGYYLAPGQGCHVFHRCVGGHKFSHYCPPGQLFSFQAQGCDVQENVVCPEPAQIVQGDSGNKTSPGDVT